jgi:hypothetical protein
LSIENHLFVNCRLKFCACGLWRILLLLFYYSFVKSSHIIHSSCSIVDDSSSSIPSLLILPLLLLFPNPSPLGASFVITRPPELCFTYMITTTLQQIIDERISFLKEQINEENRPEVNKTFQLHIDAIRSVEVDYDIEEVNPSFPKRKPY